MKKVAFILVLMSGNDTMHNAVVPAGAEIGVRIVTATASTGGKVSWSFKGR